MVTLTPPNRPECVVMGVLMPLVAGLIVALRLYGRWMSTHFGIDDYLAVASFVMTLAQGIAMIIGTIRSGLGQSSLGVLVDQQGFATSNDLINNTKVYVEIADWLSPWALMFAKLSLLFFYRRIFFGKVFNIVSWTMIIVLIIWGIGAGMLGIFQCGPKVYLLFSDARTIQEKCLSGAKLGIAYAATDVVTDLIVLLMPIYWVNKLQLDRAKKIMVLSTFAFGSLAALSSIVRTIVNILIYPDHQANPDQLGYFTSIVYFLMLECGLAVIAACLPTFGVLISNDQKRRLGRFIDSKLGSRGSGRAKQQTNSATKLREKQSPHHLPAKNQTDNTFDTTDTADTYIGTPYEERELRGRYEMHEPHNMRGTNGMHESHNMHGTNGMHSRPNRADVETNVISDVERPLANQEEGQIFARTDHTRMSHALR